MSDTFDDRFNNSTRYIKRRVSDSPVIIDIGDESSENKIVLKPAFWNSVLAGGIAGIVVDFTLYPLDTVKTRLQSAQGFRRSGGFRKLYKGVVPVMLCSAPVSALFFCVYNSIINLIRTEKSQWDPFVYVIAASAAEVLCSTVRVPLEVLKQRKQTSDKNSCVIIKKAVQKEGFLGLYRGFSSTIAREVPFACIQFPLWEYMIDEWIIYQNGEPLTALQTAYCGAVAGGIAGALTTPVDVIKTRIMLAEKEKIERYKPKVYQNFAKEIYFERGIRGYFSGLTPRTLWIMLGGFIYFGAYEEVKLLCEQKWCFIKNKIQTYRNWLPWIHQGTFWEHLTCTEYEEKKNFYAPSQELNNNNPSQETKVNDQSLGERLNNANLYEDKKDGLDRLVSEPPNKADLYQVTKDDAPDRSLSEPLNEGNLYENTRDDRLNRPVSEPVNDANLFQDTSKAFDFDEALLSQPANDTEVSKNSFEAPILQPARDEITTPSRKPERGHQPPPVNETSPSE